MTDGKTRTKKSPVPAEGQGKIHVSDKDREFAERCNEAAKHNKALALEGAPYQRVRDNDIKPGAWKLVVRVGERITDMARITGYLKVLVSPIACEPKEKPVYAYRAYRELKAAMLELENAKEELARLYGHEIGLEMEKERRRGDGAT